MIKVNVRHELHQYFASEQEKETLNKLINDLLNPIIIDCITYNASVDAVKTMSGNYKIVVNCEHYSTHYKMQSLLPELLPDFL